MAKWNPQDDQVPLTLAAIRRYSISIERLSTDLYVTDREKYPEVKEILARCFKDLRTIRKQMREKAKDATEASRYTTSLAGQTEPKKAFFGPTCGPGYVNCNGVCLPDCDDEQEML